METVRFGKSLIIPSIRWSHYSSFSSLTSYNQRVIASPNYSRPAGMQVLVTQEIPNPFTPCSHGDFAPLHRPLFSKYDMSTLFSCLDLAGDCNEERACAKIKARLLKTTTDFKSIHYQKVNTKSFCVLPVTEHHYAVMLDSYLNWLNFCSEIYFHLKVKYLPPSVIPVSTRFFLSFPCKFCCSSLQKWKAFELKLMLLDSTMLLSSVHLHFPFSLVWLFTRNTSLL